MPKTLPRWERVARIIEFVMTEAAVEDLMEIDDAVKRRWSKLKYNEDEWKEGAIYQLRVSGYMRGQKVRLRKLEGDGRAVCELMSYGGEGREKGKLIRVRTHVLMRMHPTDMRIYAKEGEEVW